MCDVISQWTDVMASCPAADLSKKLTQPVFTFKKRLFFKRKKTKLTNKEVTLLSHQVFNTCVLLEILYSCVSVISERQYKSKGKAWNVQI